MKRESRKFKVFSLFRFVIALGMIAIFTVGCGGDSDVDSASKFEGNYSGSYTNTATGSPINITYTMAVDASGNATLTDVVANTYTGTVDNDGNLELVNGNISFKGSISDSYDVTADMFGEASSSYTGTISGFAFAGTYEGTYTETTIDATDFTLTVDQSGNADLAVPTKTYTGVGIATDTYTVTVTEPLGTTITITISDERVVSGSDNAVTPTTLSGTKANFEGTYLADADAITLTVDSLNNLTVTIEGPQDYTGAVNSDGSFEAEKTGSDTTYTKYSGTISKFSEVAGSCDIRKIIGNLTGSKE
ncbi:hypothetical protein GMMP1_1200026 [Candidatus Magnetomoraceae bacterium gMMP-1]